ncbi:hypothetical protein [Prosthecomicrobium sp. N25]|uniref:hypothetical protein n=1 Tax=Prosthecomicrobium sp. N25 TaxID=3129254 RepID=UPI00307823BA
MMVRILAAGAAVALWALSAASAGADVIDAVKIGRWNGGALASNGTVTQCVLASRFKGAAADARNYVVFYSVSRASGFAIAIQDPQLQLEPGRAMTVKLTLDGDEPTSFDGKAVGPNVVAFYPGDAQRLKAGLAKATAVVPEVDAVPYAYPTEGAGEIVAWLDACAARHGFADSGFEKGRAEEERKLDQ